jgi:hypothetical protein
VCRRMFCACGFGSRLSSDVRSGRGFAMVCSCWLGRCRRLGRWLSLSLRPRGGLAGLSLCWRNWFRCFRRSRRSGVRRIFLRGFGSGGRRCFGSRRGFARGLRRVRLLRGFGGRRILLRLGYLRDRRNSDAQFASGRRSQQRAHSQYGGQRHSDLPKDPGGFLDSNSTAHTAATRRFPGQG